MPATVSAMSWSTTSTSAASFFASKESAFITGAELAVDGGMQATL